MPKSIFKTPFKDFKSFIKIQLFNTLEYFYLIFLKNFEIFISARVKEPKENFIYLKL